MKAHDFSVEGTVRHTVLVFCVLGSVAAASALGTWLGPVFPAPSAFALLGLSYSVIWGHFLWRWKPFRAWHRVPVFHDQYRCTSTCNKPLPPRYCIMRVRQTWTSMLIRFMTPLMEGESIAASAFPDSSSLLVTFEVKPRTVFDTEWLKSNDVSEQEARKLAVRHQSVVRFQFRPDGEIEKAEWYTDLKDNHLGVFAQFSRP